MSKQETGVVQLAALVCLALACTPGALGEEFSLTIGSPVAAQNFRAKSAVFALRTKDCAEPEKAKLSGTAEGLIHGARRTIRLEKIAAMPAPGVHVVFHEWPGEGAWVVNITAHCAAATAGALVPIGPRGFLRESSRFFPRPATEAEIEESVQSLAALAPEPASDPGK